MEPRISYISPRLNEEALQHAIAYKLMFILGKDPSLANKHEWLNATLFAVRDRLVALVAGASGADLAAGAPGILSVDGVSHRPYPLECLTVAGHL
jgi:hypothetical protein